MTSATTLGSAPASRRDRQKEQTRLDLALAAFELARDHGLAQVRVPQIAAAVGVSTRTFNNYFVSKEAAIVWPASLRAGQLAENLADRPAGQSLEDALVASVAGLYGESGPVGLPAGWQDEFRLLVAAEPALQGEYLKAASAAEGALARGIARRAGWPPTSCIPSSWPPWPSPRSAPRSCSGCAGPARRQHWPTSCATPCAWPCGA